MKRRANIFLNISLIAALTFLCACRDEAPVPQPKSVSKKIAVPAAPSPAKPAPVAPRETAPPAPQTIPENMAPQEAEPAVSKGSPAPPAAVSADNIVPAPPAGDGALAAPEPLDPPPPAAAASDNAPAPPESSDLVNASLQIAGTYDPTGRFDPFEPLIKEQTEEETASAKHTRKRRTPKTPLERMALSQLKVTAIIRAGSGNRALVEDASGKGYVIRKGTYIGLNAGRVIDIDDERIVIEEEVENIMGELTIKNAELKLQKPAGEL